MDDSDYTSAESLESSDGGGEEDEKECSDYESIVDDEVHVAGESATPLPIRNASSTHHKKKKKNRKISIKNAFRRGRNANKALDDLRRLLEEAIQSNLLLTSDDHDRDPKEIRLWGIPLLPSKGHHGTDVILMKFLQARDWKVPDAYEMLYRTLVWRRRERIDGILDEKLDISSAAEKMVFSDRTDREGRPLCFNVYGALNDADFYKALFGTDRSKEEFLRWRIQILERIIRTKFKFETPGIDELDAVRGGRELVSLIQVSDLRNVPARGLNDLIPTGKKMLSVFQDHYPDIIYRNIIINPPSWFNTLHGFLGQHCSAGTRKKFVVARSNRVRTSLLKYIDPQNIPVQYGGLMRVNDEEFAPDDGDENVFETVIKGGQHGRMEIPVPEVHVTIVWDVMVVGWEVIYKEEFVPDDEGSYKVLLHREEKIGETIRSSYYISEPGKIVITIRNSHFRKKRVFWRYKCKTTLPAYVNNQVQNP